MSDPTQRYVYVSDLNVELLSVREGFTKLPDEYEALWERLRGELDDQRTVTEKLRDACSSADKDFLETCRRTAALGHVLDWELQGKGIAAQKFQVLQACKPELAKLKKGIQRGEVKPEQIDTWIDFLTRTAMERLQKRSQFLEYPAVEETVIVECIWSLVDSCFLSFDEN